MEATTATTDKARTGTPERILIVLVIILNAITVTCLAVGVWMSLTGELPCPKGKWCIFTPNIYGGWAFGLIIYGFIAALLSLPANIMFMIRVRRPLWLYIFIVLSISFSAIVYFFHAF